MHAITCLQLLIKACFCELDKIFHRILLKVEQLQLKFISEIYQRKYSYSLGKCNPKLFVGLLKASAFY